MPTRKKNIKSKVKPTVNFKDRRLSDKDFLEEINLFREMKHPFRFEVNNHTYRIQSDIGRYFTTDNTIPMNELGFVKRVQDYVLKNKIHKRIKNDFPKNRDGTKNHTMIKYFDYKRHLKDAVYSKELFEIDWNQAYWDTAFMMGILSEELYLEGLTVKKETRLAALGALAKRTAIWYFNGKEMIYEKTIRKKTEHLWFKICERLGNSMYKAEQKAKSKKGFLMYWVDGIYVQGMDAVVAVCEGAEKDGYTYKVRRVNKLEFKVDQSEIWIHDNIDGARMFNIGKPKFKEFFRRKAKLLKKKKALKK